MTFQISAGFLSKFFTLNLFFNLPLTIVLSQSVLCNLPFTIFLSQSFFHIIFFHYLSFTIFFSQSFLHNLHYLTLTIFISQSFLHNRSLTICRSQSFFHNLSFIIFLSQSVLHNRYFNLYTMYCGLVLEMPGEYHCSSPCSCFLNSALSPSSNLQQL